MNIDSWKVMNADCREVLSGMKTNSVNCILTDAPYTEHVHKAHGSDGRICNWRKAKAFDFEALTDYSIVDQFLKVTQGWVVSFCASQQVGEWEKHSRGWFVTDGLWIKTNPKPNPFGTWPSRPHESIVALHGTQKTHKANRGRFGKKDPLQFPGGCKLFSYTFPVVPPTRRDHPTQKPVELCRAIVRDFSKPGDLILDPYMGTGSMGIAAIVEGRRYLGIEMNKTHFEKAKAKLADCWNGIGRDKPRNKDQLSLFGTTR